MTGCSSNQSYTTLEVCEFEFAFLETERFGKKNIAIEQLPVEIEMFIRQHFGSLQANDTIIAFHTADSCYFLQVTLDSYGTLFFDDMHYFICYDAICHPYDGMDND